MNINDKILDFHMTTTCNHACVFCSEDERMSKYRNAPLSEIQIKTILVDRAKKGFNYVNFTGGEPTLFPNFIGILSFAKKLGYSIYVGTNGTMLAQEAFAEKFLTYVDVLSLSIHWFDEKTCKEQTADPLHFSRFQKICKNVKTFKNPRHYYQTNIVMNALNYRYLTHIIRNTFNTAYPLDHVLVSYVAPEGLAKKNYSTLSFPYKEAVPYIKEAREFCEARDIQFRIFGIPLCELGSDFEKNSNDVYWNERHTIERFTNKDGKITLVDIYSPDNSRKRTFVKKCENCTWKLHPCTGVFEEYLQFYPF